MAIDKEIENEIENLKYKGWVRTFKPSQKLEKCIKRVKSPNQKYIFNAFNNLTPKTTKVFILGQDPYPQKGRAHGYAFSFGDNKKPAEDSLLNIYKAIQKAYNPQNDINTWNTNLASWAKTYGVLLLNTALTHEKDTKTTINKHIKAWKPFIEDVINNLLTCNSTKLVVFLWGDKAKSIFFNYTKGTKISRDILVLISNHPSNLSVNHGGNFPILVPNHFKACNDFLGKDAIKWDDI